MSTVSISIPDSVKRNVERLAAKDGISVDQFYATAAAEKLSALETADTIAQRAARADRGIPARHGKGAGRRARGMGSPAAMSHTFPARQFANARLLAKQSDLTKRLHAAGYL